MYNIYTKAKTIFDTQATPAYLENQINTDIQIPCITYFLSTDISTIVGDTQQYSTAVLRVSVWATTMSECVPIAQSVDDLMRVNGFKRTSVTDMVIDNGLMKKIITYTCNIKEDI